MKRILNRIIIMTMVVLALACTDDSLDPFRLTEIQKGSILALRGDGDAEANFFFKDNIQTTDAFFYEAEFLSETQDLLSEVQVFARILKGPRTLVATVPGSSFVIPTGGTLRLGTVTVPLSAVLAGVGITIGTAPTLKRTDIVIETDIILSDGSTVPASAIVNGGLFQSAIFFPAMVLNYYADVQADFTPKATTKMAGEVVKNSAGAVTSRPVFPLKSGSRDTLLITYAGKVLNAPAVSFSPVSAVTVIGTVTELPNKKATDVTQTFFQIVEANGTTTGPVTATVTGAQWEVHGVALTQAAKTQTVNVDNTVPQVITTATGSRIGKGQIVTVSLTFNEKMSAKSANAIKVTITGQNLEAVTAQSMTLSSTGLVASYTYVYKLANAAVPATHGPLTLTFTGGADESGNALTAGALDGAIASLVVDVGTPPAPSLTLDGGGHDLGTQIKWSAAQTTGGSNALGSRTGTVYYIAIPYTGDPLVAGAAPTAFEVDSDGVATWTKGTGTAATTSTQTFANGIQLVNGTSGTLPIYSSFAANGTFDIYAVFVGNTGNVSAISTPAIPGVVMMP